MNNLKFNDENNHWKSKSTEPNAVKAKELSYDEEKEILARQLDQLNKWDQKLEACLMQK